MRNRSRHGLLWDLGAAVSVVLLPLVIFLKHNSYPLSNPETVLLVSLVIMAGLFCGVLMNLGPRPTRIVVLVFLAVLVVDIQTHWITTWGLRLLLNVLFFSGLFWLLRKRLSQAVALLAGAMLLGTLLMPAREQIRLTGPPLDELVPRPDLPFILHIILDGHIGIEGLPRQFDPDRTIAGEVRDSYLDLGFRVFGRAYSDYYLTLNTMPHLLNFTVTEDAGEYQMYPPQPNQALTENAWFDLLSEQGYRAHIYQPEYLTYDRDPQRTEGQGVESSLTYGSNSIYPLVDVDMPVGDKAQYILVNFSRLSFFLSLMRDGFQDLRQSRLGLALGLPAWDQAGRYLSAQASMTTIEVLERDLETAGPGQAFFVHLLLPHWPYAYDRDCGMLEVEKGWLIGWDPALHPVKNTPESRAVRYLAYQEQLICTTNRIHRVLEKLSERAWWDDAIVVVHGDHGARIDLVIPRVPNLDEFSDQGLMDGFSTMFAVKMPGVAPGYDRRQLPVGHLFKSLVRDGADPGDPELESHPRVRIADGENPMLILDLPFFDHGLPMGSTVDGE
jgi:hypothetical protein